VDITDRIIRNHQAGQIDHQPQPILQRLGLSNEQCLTLTTEFEKHCCYVADAEMMMKQLKVHTGHQRIRQVQSQNAAVPRITLIKQPLTH
jgi:hypothetical protein